MNSEKGRVMAKTKKIDPPADTKYRRVEISDLNRKRRGKHHELVQEILKELKTAPAGSALEIPLADVGGIGLPNLRSAVHRAATGEGLTIETLADEKNFYVWKKNAEQ
jgi:hypothetical protein